MPKTPGTSTELEKELLAFDIKTHDAKDIQFISTIEDVDTTRFRGNDLDILFGLLYVLQKYNNGCSPIQTHINKKNTLFDNLGINWVCKRGKRQMTLPKDFIKNFNTCKKKKTTKFIFIFLTFMNSKTCRSYNNDAHANLIIYTKSKNTFERFEPNGCSTEFSIWFESKEFDRKFNALAKNVFKAEYKTPLTCCPYIGIQSIQEHERQNLKINIIGPEGYCAAYSLWIIALRIQNPKEDFQKLQLLAIKKMQKNDKAFTQFIHNFSKYITDKRQELLDKLPERIVKSIERNPDTLHNLSPDSLKIVNDFVVKEYKKIK